MTTQDWEENVRVIPQKSAWPRLDTGLTESERAQEHESERAQEHKDEVIEAAKRRSIERHPSAQLSEARKARASAIAKAVNHIEIAQYELEQAIDWVEVYASGRDFTLTKNALSATVNQIHFDADSEQERR